MKKLLTGLLIIAALAVLVLGAPTAKASVASHVVQAQNGSGNATVPGTSALNPEGSDVLASGPGAGSATLSLFLKCFWICCKHNCCLLSCKKIGAMNLTQGLSLPATDSKPDSVTSLVLGENVVAATDDRLVATFSQVGNNAGGRRARVAQP